MERYKRDIKYHDKNNEIQKISLRIDELESFFWVSWYCLENKNSPSKLNSKIGSQTELETLKEKWKSKQNYEKKEIEEIIQFQKLYENICNEIEKEEQEYIEYLNYHNKEKITDEKIVALMLQLNITIAEAILDIKKSKYSPHTYCYGEEEYLVMTDEEANNLFEEELDNFICEVMYTEIPEQYHKYINIELYKEDEKSVGRENYLANYDCNEGIEVVNNTNYYIYRRN